MRRTKNERKGKQINNNNKCLIKVSILLKRVKNKEKQFKEDGVKRKGCWITILKLRGYEKYLKEIKGLKMVEHG